MVTVIPHIVSQFSVLLKKKKSGVQCLSSKKYNEWGFEIVSHNSFLLLSKEQENQSDS